MKSRNLLLVAVTGALAGWQPAAEAQQKYVVLSNVDAVSGQAQVTQGGQPKAAIPVQGNAQVDPSGNIVVTCQTGTHGTGCSNIGAGSSGSLTQPTITFNGPTATVAANDTTARLHWTTSNARTCYGLAAPSGVSGWTKEWATGTTGSNGFQVGNLTRDANNDTIYNFTLRCYSIGTATMGATPVVAYTDSTYQVTLAPSGTTPPPPPPAGSCSSYLASLSPAEKAHYDAYDANQRGFTKVEKTFTAHTQKTLGVNTGLIGSSPPVLPGMLQDAQYLALSFSLPLANAVNSGKFSMSFTPPIGAGVEHNIIVTISPCPGDFRPQDGDSTDPYVNRIQCRKEYSTVGAVRAGSAPTTLWCPSPADTTMYINVALRNMYESGTAATLPSDACGSSEYCGSGPSLSK
ncbi:hypothetical protein OS187_09500 [Xanthomonadaceae bacterium JHOS43]|nr:hypothetical protein [Xanthomonadaceae bacterium JHOS43]